MEQRTDISIELRARMLNAVHYLRCEWFQVGTHTESCDWIMSGLCCAHDADLTTIPRDKKAGESGNGGSSWLCAASCAQLRAVKTQEIVRSYQAASFTSNALGNFARRPPRLLTELRDPAIRYADRAREVATFDAGGFEVCG